MKVFIIIESTSVDYHGRYDDIIGVYADKSKAQKIVNKLNDTRKYDVEYCISEWEIKK